MSFTLGLKYNMSHYPYKKPFSYFKFIVFCKLGGHGQKGNSHYQPDQCSCAWLDHWGSTGLVGIQCAASSWLLQPGPPSWSTYDEGSKSAATCLKGTGNGDKAWWLCWWKFWDQYGWISGWVKVGGTSHLNEIEQWVSNVINLVHQSDFSSTLLVYQ